MLTDLCSIRALKFYLKMTSSYCRNWTRLFLPIQGKQSMKGYSRYQRQRHPSPQVVNVQTTEQPARIIEEAPNIHSNNVVQQLSKDSGSEYELEAWSFDKAINEDSGDEQLGQDWTCSQQLSCWLL